MSLIKRSMVLTLALLVSACSVVGPVNSCDIFAAVYLSKDDVLTDDTVRQIYKHNETGKEVCGWEPIK